MADAPAHLEPDFDPTDAPWPPPNETAGARAARLERERVMIEEAEEDFRNGDYLEGPALKEWFRKLLAGEPLPEDRK